MSSHLDKYRHHKSSSQGPYPYKESEAWGTFVRYVELGDDGYVLRQVDEFENGYLTRYDRGHWDDQFGTLADLRFSAEWEHHWGMPTAITSREFEAKWAQAASSPIEATRHASSGAPPWIQA